MSQPTARRGAFFVRDLHPGMGQAVGERTVLRKIFDWNTFPTVSANDPNYRLILSQAEQQGRGIAVDYDNRTPPWPWRWETWGEVAQRVAFGNAALIEGHAYHDREPGHRAAEYEALKHHLSKATLLMSGRHLQHGDATQPGRNMEVFVNCATAPATFLLFQLLLNGAGVGRCYDDDMMLVDWDHAPSLRVVLSAAHPDFDYSAHEDARDARHKYGAGKNVVWHRVGDSREGWAKALELYETMAFERVHAHKLLVLDFSSVRPKGAPIRGMQNRPSSGPVPLMNAFMKAASIKGAGMDPWMQAVYIDHYFAECVLVGGARRAARMSTKHWRDRTVLEFIQVKRPVEYRDKSMAEVIEFRRAYFAKHGRNPDPFLWSSNNSVVGDDEFWQLSRLPEGHPLYWSKDAKWARKVHKTLTECAYADGTGEPGLLNGHKLIAKDSGSASLLRGDYVGSRKYQVDPEAEIYLGRLARAALGKKYHYIVNPCGEIVLFLLGGYCVIGDVVPYHAETLEEAEEAFRVATRALVRVNLMDSLYAREVQRTNRIGVGMTGVHEFAWKFFGVGFRDLINPDFGAYQEWRDNPDDPSWDCSFDDPRTRAIRAAAFWLTLARFSRAVQEEAVEYSRLLGMVCPHTALTIKPAGTTSKLFGLTEGWHLPALAWMMRWVQFRADDPLVEDYRTRGYPVRDLVKYPGTTIVGFPTQPVIGDLGLGDALVLAGDATPEEQYRWLLLGEKFYINGTDEAGNDLHGPGEGMGNQISYTLKYKPEAVGYAEFVTMLDRYQPQIRACSVMPQEDQSAYEYLPEQPITKAEFEGFAAAIREAMAEDIGREHVDCAGGACPIDFDETRKEGDAA